jgi:hypothetical protein
LPRTGKPIWVMDACAFSWSTTNHRCPKPGTYICHTEIGLLATNRPILEGSDFCLPAGFLRHFFLDDRWEDELALPDPYVWKTAITDRAPHGARVQAVLGSEFFDGERSRLSERRLIGCHTNLHRGAHICTLAQHWTRLVLQRYFTPFLYTLWRRTAMLFCDF